MPNIYRADVEQTVLTVLVDEPTAHPDARHTLVTRALRTAWRNLAQNRADCDPRAGLAAGCDILVRAVEYAGATPGPLQGEYRPRCGFPRKPRAPAQDREEYGLKAPPRRTPPQLSRPRKWQACRLVRKPAHPEGTTGIGVRAATGPVIMAAITSLQWLRH